ncbi:S-adenosyl methyltransferase [Saccharopolyspora erythraea NRRL 2338]|uniref:Uncharacterized protein n=2 Tax=Saccharopolyspora erythraea TaxID=1836 RepID=A4FKM8_SACEN|nr:SAM-dependent methyltransferase [Saccharopolyspora erythraea]EQD84523.1 hypothetical protein N599_19760 [Saccharopolyspora erythraea D]PFG98241.1 S-adenosyl methyltransferase [Saccharopolyspora erythraea NRRL 2338]QRK88337.1 SAM-dependent methyltransferase [Saccharopolyspora erythraea]CAM04603.1 hypothetical protein SACE_5365 [Saccharopolyspora erythraea NRRL 2338]
MSDPTWLTADHDLDRPNGARIYDFYLGGQNNLLCDRTYARRLLALVPDLRHAALENRACMRRVVRMFAERGIRQFLDLGSGIPTAGNTHETAREVAPDCRVVYVDSEPMAVAHGELLLDGDPNTAIVRKDVRDVRAVLDDEQTRRLLDFDQPVAVLLFALMQFIPDDDDPEGMLGQYRDALVPGSYLALSHLTGDDRPEEMEAVRQLTMHEGRPNTLRSRERVRELLAGFELVEPGVVHLPQWRPDPGHRDDEIPVDRSMAYVAVGCKP